MHRVQTSTPYLPKRFFDANRKLQLCPAVGSAVVHVHVRRELQVDAVQLFGNSDVCGALGGVIEERLSRKQEVVENDKMRVSAKRQARGEPQ